MSEPENQFQGNVPQENAFSQAPVYGAPQQPPRSQDVPAEPARLNWLQRWFGVLFSPGETFADINRKPTIIAPIIILVVITATAAAVIQWKLAPFMPDLIRTQMKKTLERFGQTPTEEQLQQSVNQQLMIAKFSPLIAAVFTPITYLVVAGVFALGMLLIQAKATFKKIYSVILWTFAAIGVISSIVFIASLMVKDEESLRSINLNNPTETVPTNIGAFLGPETSPIIRSLAGSIDIFSFWTIAILAIGFAAIANSKNVKTGKTAVMVIVLWGIYVLAKVGFSGFIG